MDEVPGYIPFQTSRASPIEMKGLLNAGYVRNSMTYGGNTWPLLADASVSIFCLCFYIPEDPYSVLCRRHTRQF